MAFGIEFSRVLGWFLIGFLLGFFVVPALYLTAVIGFLLMERFRSGRTTPSQKDPDYLPLGNGRMNAGRQR